MTKGKSLNRIKKIFSRLPFAFCLFIIFANHRNLNKNE